MCGWLNLLWFFTPLEPFQCYPNLIGRAYISIFSIIVPWKLEILCNKKLFSLRRLNCLVLKTLDIVHHHGDKGLIHLLLLRLLSIVSNSYLILRQIIVKVKAFLHYFHGFRPIFYLHGRAYRLIPHILCYFSVIFGIYYSFSR